MSPEMKGASLLILSVCLQAPPHPLKLMKFTPIIIISLQDNLKVGFIVSIAARSTNSLLKVASNGMVDCSGALKQPPDMECQFEVIGPAGAQPTAIRLRSVAYPQFYLAIVNGFFIGYVSYSDMGEEYVIVCI